MPGVPRGQSPGIPAAPCTPKRREWFCPSSQIVCRISCGKYAVDGYGAHFWKMRNSIEPDNATAALCPTNLTDAQTTWRNLHRSPPTPEYPILVLVCQISMLLADHSTALFSKKRFSLVLRRTRDGIFAILTPYVEARYHRPGKVRDSSQTDKTLSYQPNTIRQPRTFCCVQPVNALL